MFLPSILVFSITKLSIKRPIYCFALVFWRDGLIGFLILNFVRFNNKTYNKDLSVTKFSIWGVDLMF